MKKKERILFVSHLATRSGAPLLLLEIIKYFSEQKKIDFDILCMEEGELVEEFRRLGKTYVWKNKPLAIHNRWINRIAIIFGRAKQILHGSLILYRVRKCNLVFYNTIVNGHIQKKLSFAPSKTICYVHELEIAIHMLTNANTRKIIFEQTGLFLCVSEAVRNNLIDRYQVPEKNARLVSSPLSKTYRDKETYREYINNFKTDFQIGNASVIGVVATNEWRKGFDFFVPLINLYFTLFPQANTFFVWKGFRNQAFNSLFDRYDVERCKYSNRILLMPHDKQSMEQMACLDIHLLLSREDPYPLVVLEAATFGIPTVCFDQAGGAQEFVENDCGAVVPFADLHAMAISLHQLVNDKALLLEMDANCRLKVKMKHDKDRALKEITNIIVQKMNT